MRTETDPGRWQTAYDFPALREGRVVKEGVPDRPAEGRARSSCSTRAGRSSPICACARRSRCCSISNGSTTTCFFDLYRRTASYFEGSELSARGRPADARERALLAPFPGAVRADVLDGTWSPPVSDGSGRDRTILRRALALFAPPATSCAEPSWSSARSGRPLTFEIMVTTRNEGTDEERLALLFASNLKRAGITVRVRPVDAVQFEARRIGFDFDMIQNRWDQSLSPGNEQAFYWGSAAADQNGSRNYMGVKSPAVDAMIAALLKARTAPTWSRRCARSTAC